MIWRKTGLTKKQKGHYDKSNWIGITRSGNRVAHLRPQLATFFQLKCVANLHRPSDKSSDGIYHWRHRGNRSRRRADVHTYEKSVTVTVTVCKMRGVNRKNANCVGLK